VIDYIERRFGHGSRAAAE